MSNIEDFGVIKEAQFVLGTSNWALNWMTDFLQGARSSISDISLQAKRMTDQLPALDRSAAATTQAGATGLSGLSGQAGQPTRSA